jgi:hypothetical protein
VNKLFGRRKYSIAVGALILTAVLIFAGKVSGDHWPTSIGLIIGLYGAASVGNQWAKTGGKDNG